MSRSASPIDVLVVSWNPLWPVTDGAAVCGCHMSQALARGGVRIAVATVRPAESPAPAALAAGVRPWPQASDVDAALLQRGWSGPGAPLRKRFAEHEGVSTREAAGVLRLVRELRPRAVVGVGRHSPLLLRALRGLDLHERPYCVWYAADELIAHHLSCLARSAPRDWRRGLYELAQHACLERLFARGVDAAIGVSPRDTALLRHVAGARQAWLIRNGVDLEYWKASPQTAACAAARGEASVIFWGRMDFAPNVDAVTWFAQQVWPQLQRDTPGATFRIVGANPVPVVARLEQCDGIEVTGAVPDIRPLAQASDVVVLPMRCGGGIKNKLLEASAMGLPIVASARAVSGLTFDHAEAPLRVCRSAAQWRDAVRELWSNPTAAAQHGAAARRWVERQHGWDVAARTLLDHLHACGALRGETMSLPTQRRAA